MTQIELTVTMKDGTKMPVKDQIELGATLPEKIKLFGENETNIAAGITIKKSYASAVRSWVSAGKTEKEIQILKENWKYGAVQRSKKPKTVEDVYKIASTLSPEGRADLIKQLG